MVAVVVGDLENEVAGAATLAGVSVDSLRDLEQILLFIATFVLGVEVGDQNVGETGDCVEQRADDTLSEIVSFWMC